MKILLIEDEEELRNTVREYLTREKFIVECAEDYASAMEKVNDYDYDCILLDIMLPGGSGLSVLAHLKRMRKQESVIIISAKDSIEDRKKAGGDTSIVLGNLTLVPDTRKVTVDGNELNLNRKEFDLLYYFISNPNRLINRMALAESVWGDHIDQADSLDFIYSQVKNLRKKMKAAGTQAEIKAVYGFGYKLAFDIP